MFPKKCFRPQAFRENLFPCWYCLCLLLYSFPFSFFDVGCTKPMGWYNFNIKKVENLWKRLLFFKLPWRRKIIKTWILISKQGPQKLKRGNLLWDMISNSKEKKICDCDHHDFWVFSSENQNFCEGLRWSHQQQCKKLHGD